MEINFPGGVAVNAEVDGHLVRTDQLQKYGGEDSAPRPFDLFLASIGTCAGFYALRFCQQREIDSRDLKVTLEAIKGPDLKKVERIVIDVELPGKFPEKYRKAIIRAIDQCAVKRSILEPPEFEVNVAIPAIA